MCAFEGREDWSPLHTLKLSFNLGLLRAQIHGPPVGVGIRPAGRPAAKSMASSDLFSAQRQPVADEPAPSWKLRPDGWGYEDTEFDLTEKGQITLKGARYPFSGMVFPNFRPWIEKVLGINIEDRIPLSPVRAQDPPIRNEPFIVDLQACSKTVSFTDEDRLFHGHGHTCQEVYALRFGKLRRIPDAVVWPSSHAEVEARQRARRVPHPLRRRQLRRARSSAPPMSAA